MIVAASGGTTISAFGRQGQRKPRRQLRWFAVTGVYLNAGFFMPSFMTRAVVYLDGMRNLRRMPVSLPYITALEDDPAYQPHPVFRRVRRLHWRAMKRI